MTSDDITPPLVPCRECGTPFRFTKFGRKFCSTSCQQSAHYALRKRILEAGRKLMAEGGRGTLR